MNEATKEALRLLSGLLTPLIAVVAAYIAYQQYRTNELKLRLDLYQVRFKVFRALMDFIGSVVSERNISAAVVRQFDAETNESSFLFGKDISEYLALVRGKAEEITTINAQIEPLMQYERNEERTRLTRDKVKLIEWFYAQLPISKAKFAEYLAIAD